MVNSPCLDCPDRTPGCHKPEACSAWAEFQKALTAEKNVDLLEAQCRKYRPELAVMTENCTTQAASSFAAVTICTQNSM